MFVIFILGSFNAIMSDQLKDQISILLYIKNILADLIYINGIIATEAMKITENTAAIRHGEEFLHKSNCLKDHHELNKKVLELIKKYKPKLEDFSCLEKHLFNHAKNLD